jgi:hypothetical protein
MTAEGFLEIRVTGNIELPYIEACRQLVRQLVRALQQQHDSSYPFFLGAELRPPVKGTASHRDLILIGQERKSCRPALRALRQTGAHMAELAIANMLDHLDALRAVLATDIGEDKLPAFAHASLVRVIAEAAATACRWYDPDSDTVTRLLRTAVARRYDAEQDKKACDALPSHLSYAAQARQGADQRLSGASKLISDAGITEGVGRDGKTLAHLVWRDGRKIPTKIEWSTEVASLFPDLFNLYQMGSGAIHSVPWHLGEVLLPSPTAASGFRASANPLSVGGAVDAALAVCSKMIERFGAYWGIDTTDLLQKTEVRRKTVLVYMEEYAAAVQASRALSGS